MCTVTYFPLNSGEFILTSNRDETPKRQPNELYYDSDKKILYPKEPVHGGTWICISERDQVLCLLNGAFEKHKHNPPYRKSRGLVLLEFFENNGADEFINNYDFNDIEPFTLIISEKGSLYDLKWDGKTLHQLKLDSSLPHIWSSSTLYPENIKKMRESWFNDWISSDSENKATHLWNFHEKAGTGDKENDLIMSRFDGKLCTVSSTQIVKRQSSIEMKYLDRVENLTLNKKLELL